MLKVKINNLKLDHKIKQLLASGKEPNLRLAAQIMKGHQYELGSPADLIKVVVQKFLKIYLPNTDYHRFGPTLMDKNTFEIIHQRIQSYLEAPYMEVEVCADFLKLAVYIQLEPGLHFKKYEILLEGLTDNLYHALKVKYDIGKRPLDV